MKKDKYVPSKAKLLFAGLLSIGVVVGLCVLQYVDVPFDINAWWFRLLALVLVVGCYFLVGWSMGVFHQDSALAFTPGKNAKHIHLRLHQPDMHQAADLIVRHVLLAGYQRVEASPAGGPDGQPARWFRHCTRNQEAYVCVAALPQLRRGDLQPLTEASEALLRHTDERLPHFQCLLLLISSASEKDADQAVKRCCSYAAAGGESIMLLSGHLNPHTGALSVSPPSAVGYCRWQKARRHLVSLIGAPQCRGKST